MGRTSRGRCASLLDGFLASAAECGAARNKEKQTAPCSSMPPVAVVMFRNLLIHDTKVMFVTPPPPPPPEVKASKRVCMCEKNTEQARTFPVRIVNTHTCVCVCV